jgi:lysine 2,3-aminomutase
MKGVNDDAEVMKELFLKLLKIRVRPYYLYMADETRGANHFRTSVDKGLEIMFKLRGNISGLAIPHFVIDAPGGGGKIPILPQYVLHRDDDRIVMRNFRNEVYVYREAHNDEKVEDNFIQIEISTKKDGSNNGSSKKPKNYKDVKTIQIDELEVSRN